MAEEETGETFEERLIAAMAEMANPAKSATATVPTKGGGRYTYSYETLDQVLSAVRPALLRHGLGLIQQQRWDADREGYVLETVVFGASRRKVVDERPMIRSTDPQALGSWETYMRRYALRCAFGLCGEDDDGKAAKDSAERAAKRPEKRPPARQGKPDRRKRMLARCAQLSADFIAAGGNVGATDSYMSAAFGAKSMDELSDEQLEEFGRYLANVAKQMQEQRDRKAAEHVDQQRDD